MIQNTRLLQALFRQPVDRTPVWLMRQAGRYLPEYRALRQKAGSFLTMCKTPELACEVTLQPLKRFPLDAAIIFSDILTLPDAMGLGLYFVEGEGPHFKSPLTQASDIKKLGLPDPNIDLHYVMEAIRTTQHALAGSVPLIGFSGSPWTLATYMIEGQSGSHFEKIIAWHKSDPASLHALLKLLAQGVADYLNAQIEAGVNAVMIFDTWGNLLSDTDYATFSLSYISEIMSQLKRDHAGARIPVTVFTKNTRSRLDILSRCGADAVSIDTSITMGEARQRVGAQVALQGNLDPQVLYRSPEEVRGTVKNILDDFGPHPGHIFNLAHGVPQDIPLENVAALVEAVQNA